MIIQSRKECELRKDANVRFAETFGILSVDADYDRDNVFNRVDSIRPPSRFHSVFGAKRNVMFTLRSDF